MSKKVDVAEAARLLMNADNILILTHKNPDGDTLGSGFALWKALRLKGKNARVLNERAVPSKYSFLSAPHDTEAANFEPGFIVAVDAATEGMLGEIDEKFKHADLAIDHHGTHESFENAVLCRPGSASCCEIIYKVIGAMDVTPDGYIADALFTGISTDTGCFKYSNTTPETHRTAAQLIEFGARAAELNRLFFDTKSRERFALESEAMSSLRFYEDGKVAAIIITREMLKNTGCSDSDIEGITPIPRTIEGVEVGITVRETYKETIKASLRSNAYINVADICAGFGGGGHIRAAGCEFEGKTADEVIDLLLNEIKKVL